MTLTCKNVHVVHNAHHYTKTKICFIVRLNSEPVMLAVQVLPKASCHPTSVKKHLEPLLPLGRFAHPQTHSL